MQTLECLYHRFNEVLNIRSFKSAQISVTAMFGSMSNVQILSLTMNHFSSSDTVTVCSAAAVTAATTTATATAAATTSPAAAAATASAAIAVAAVV